MLLPKADLLFFCIGRRDESTTELDMGRTLKVSAETEKWVTRDRLARDLVHSSMESIR